MKVAFVVQRYGRGIDGGSETLCREVATRLAKDPDLDVSVLTTTARDYLTWKAEMREGETDEDGVRVRRFSVVRRRRVNAFGRLSDRLFASRHSLEDEIDWMIRQGPRVPSLLTHLEELRTEIDAFVFFTYLYYPTAFGLPIVSEKSVLVPTLHDERPARFAIFRPVFRLPRAFVWQTPEERDFAVQRFGHDGSGEIAGFGVPLPEPPPRSFAQRRGLGEYLLFLGRIDVSKGVPELLLYFSRYRRERAPELSLVLAGREHHFELPKDPGIVPVGWISEEEKQAALAGALATVVPSAYESLSVVALESWAQARPVLASVRSAALAGQCRRSGAGLSYRTYDEFAAALDRIRAGEGAALGASGREFVARECSWERVLGVYRRAIAVAAGAR